MILKSSPLDIIQVVPAATAPSTTPSTTLQISVIADVTDTDKGTGAAFAVQKPIATVLTGTGPQTVIDAPATDKVRTVNNLSILNVDVNPVTLDVNQVNSLGATTPLRKAVTLQSFETLQFGFNVGWQVLDANSFLKISGGETAAEEAAEAAISGGSVPGILFMIAKILARMDNPDGEDDVLNELADPDYNRTVDALVGT